MSNDKIQLMHPEGKNAPAISMEIFTLFEQAIIEVLKKHQPLTFALMAGRVGDYLGQRRGGFQGSVPWYSVCVKQHLEATGAIITKTEKGTKMHYLK